MALSLLNHCSKRIEMQFHASQSTIQIHFFGNTHFISIYQINDVVSQTAIFHAFYLTKIAEYIYICWTNIRIYKEKKAKWTVLSSLIKKEEVKQNSYSLWFFFQKEKRTCFSKWIPNRQYSRFCAKKLKVLLNF